MADDEVSARPERSALRHRALVQRSSAGTELAKREGVEIRIFLLGDAVGCAVAGQQVPNGYYNLERMIKAAAHRGAEIGCCGSCLDARGITDERLAEGAGRSSLEELTDWALWADRVVSF